MTFSILAIDPDTQTLGGGAATGSLCVGGWVLRGDPRCGMSASQGASPSTLWGEQALELMGAGSSALQAVEEVTGKDAGRRFRQLAALDLDGKVAAFTGEANPGPMGARPFKGGIVSGNTLGSEQVLAAMQRGYSEASGALAERLLAALIAGEQAGGDSRGLQSAALLVVGRHASPLTLRIDYDEQPIAALDRLYRRSQNGAYAGWARQVPTLDAPERGLDPEHVPGASD